MSLALIVYLGGPAIGALVCAWVLSFYGGSNTRLIVGAGGPIHLILLLTAVVPAVWDPSPSCEEECWGRLIYGLWLVSSVITLELGLLLGWVHRRIVHGRATAESLW